MTGDVSRRRSRALELAAVHVHPARVEMLSSFGMDFVAGRSEGYSVWDLDGREYLDLDLRAGVYNLGHRNPVVTAALVSALEHADMGFALYTGERQAALAQTMAASADLDAVVFTPSGTEANDVAIQVARRVTGARRIASSTVGYHGATGAASQAGNPAFARAFNSDDPAAFPTVPPYDLDALETVLDEGDVAAVLLEPVPNAAGYLPAPVGYWDEVRSSCTRHGALLILDEIVTGLGRSGRTWGFEVIGVRPDIVVAGKALSGGVYPIAAVMLSADAAGWLHEDIGGYNGTFAGGELACAVGQAAFELSTSEATLANVAAVGAAFSDGLADIEARHPIVTDVRQFGLGFGLEFALDDGGVQMLGALFERGVMTFIAANDPSVINIKPGLLADEHFCGEVLSRVDDAVGALS